jgi:hypothetical protein
MIRRWKRPFERALPQVSPESVHREAAKIAKERKAFPNHDSVKK